MTSNPTTLTRTGEGFPYRSHRTVAEVWADAHSAREKKIAALDSMSRARALTDPESLELERLIRRVA